MMTTPDHPVSCVRRPPRQIFFGFFWGILGASAVLALLILLLPGSVFLAFSNYLQILTAFVVMAAFACAWLRCGGTPAYPYAAVGFGLWGVSNIAWYLIVLTGQRALVFPSLIDLGMIASFLLLAVAFRKGFPKTMVPRQLLSGLLAFCLIVPAAIIVAAGLSASTVITLAYFLATVTFLTVGLQHSLAENRKPLAGSLLFAVTFMIYPVREMFYAGNPVLPVIGTFVSAGFALMAIGWLSQG